MNIAFLCNTSHKVKWVDNLPKWGDYKTIYLNYGEEITNAETMKILEEFKPDVIHVYWREHKDFPGTRVFITHLKNTIKTPLMLQLDYQPRWLDGDDLIFANLGDIFVSGDILVNEFPLRAGLTVPVYYIGSDEWGAGYEVLFHNGEWIKFKDVYDRMAGVPTLFTKGGFMKFNKKTQQYEDYIMNICKKEDRKRLWATNWHDRPEMPMDDKFKIMNMLGSNYKCRWFNGWEANSRQQMIVYASGQHVPEANYEAYEWMGLEYWEKVSECMCAVDNMYWGTCSLGMESAAFKIPLVGNNQCTTAVVMNPKLVTDNIKEQAMLVSWLIDNPEEAQELGQEAYDNYIEHYSNKNKLERFETALKMVGL